MTTTFFVEADGIVMTNPMKDVKTKTLPTKKVLVPVCEKNYPLPLNVPNVPYIP